MLCKNSLPYKHELSVQGLLGITLDKEDIFLVNIKEILKPHEFVPPKIDSDDDDRLVMREGSLSPAGSAHEEADSYRDDANMECSTTVPTRAVVPIFKGPNKAQHSHKRAAPSNSSELSRHMLASAAHQGSGDSRVVDWEDNAATPPRHKRRNMWSGQRFDSPAIPIDVDRLPEIKKETTDENVTPESMTKYQHMVKYQHHHANDNLSNLNELTNFAAVHMGQEETESKRVLPPVSLPSIAGMTGPSWHAGTGDILSTSVSSLPNLSSDMISAGLPSGHLNNSMVSNKHALFRLTFSIKWIHV